MRIRSVVPVLAFGATFLVGVPVATSSTQTARLPGCATTPHESARVHHESPGQWAWDYQLFWCANGGRIEWVVPVVTHEVPDGSDCEWVSGRETQYPEGDGVIASAMSDFSCETAAGKPSDVIAWGIVELTPGGHSRVVDKGID